MVPGFLNQQKMSICAVLATDRQSGEGRKDKACAC
jgi:hypothetical protein